MSILLIKVPVHAVLLFLLVALSVVVVCSAKLVPKHRCYFDALQASHKTHLPTVEPMKGSHGSSSRTRGPTIKEWKSLRISLSTEDLHYSKQCWDGALFPLRDESNNEHKCTPENRWNDRTGENLLKIVKVAVLMHTQRLRVVPIQNGFQVPELKGPICEQVTVPDRHKTEGVKDTDMLLYVTSFPTHKREMFAAGAPCALLRGDNRPVVGALAFVTKHIKPTAYSVRVAAHEIAHALGFTYTMMKEKFNMTIDTRYVRYKTVTEVQTKRVKESVAAHYKCYDWRKRGMELEDEAGILHVVSRSHWERRNALEELMAGIVTAGLYTILTLALFEDTGVYQADFDKAEPMEWASGADCWFFTQYCVDNPADVSKDWSWMFCSDYNDEQNGKLFCAPGRRAMGRCSPILWEKYVPKPYRYFYWSEFHPWGTGETRLLTDRCPIFEEDDELSCLNKHGKAPGHKGPDHWCLREDTYVTSTSKDFKSLCVPLKTSQYDMWASNAECKTYQKIAEVSYGNKVYKLQCPSKDAVKKARDFSGILPEHWQ